MQSKQTAIRFTSDHLAMIDFLKERQGKTASEIIREGVVREYKRQKRRDAGDCEIKGGSGMKVIIAGSRTITDYERLLEAVKQSAFDITEVVSGTAQGVDTLGERYAKEHGIKLSKYPADWEQYGKSAGFRRNGMMADYADGLIALWDGASRGTKHMIRQAELREMPVFVCLKSDPPIPLNTKNNHQNK